MQDRTRLVIIRHGETDWNVAGRWQGHEDSSLTDIGVAQAEAVAERLRQTGDWDRLYTSDLGRAQRTAEIIASRIGLTVHTSTGLRERHLGIGQGLTSRDMQERHPAELAALQQRDPDHVIPGGESRRQCFDRAVGTIRTLAQRHPGDRLVVVTHGGILDQVFRFVTGISLDADRVWGIPNAGWNELEVENGGWRLQVWADVAHLGRLAPLDDADSRA